jgi:hypothetical protein
MVNIMSGRGLLPKLMTAGLLMVAVGAAALALASGAFGGGKTLRASGDDARPAQDVDPDANGKYARREKLPPRLRESLTLLGNRLANPGKERLTLAGTLSFGGGAAVPFQLIRELPDRIRLEVQADKGKQIFTFNGRHADKGGGDVNSSDEDVIETFAFDSVENLFTGPGRGASFRQLALHSQVGEGEGYTGPFYDVYEVTSDARVGKDVRRQAKLLLVNSDTLLPEAVMYERERDGAVVKVEVRFSDWKVVGGQMLPFRVVRAEDGSPSISMEVNSADSGPETQDGAFNAPGD